MGEFASLSRHFEVWAAADPERRAIVQTVEALAGAAIQLATLIGQGALAGALAAVVGENSDGDAQKALDIRADELFLAALRATPVAVFASEENETALPLNDGGQLAVAIDPLDGSSNIDTNVSLGTIFSILPATGSVAGPAVLQRGTALLAAGMVVYGPQTTLALTLGQGTCLFTLDRAQGCFRLTQPAVTIPKGHREYAINASNYRYWDDAVRSYIDDCMSGTQGPRGENFNMRWIASLVAETSRIFARGGIFLYPRDSRPGYQDGRLRLIYEANPIAFLVEQAGGAATDGERRILEIQPDALHQRVPLVFGARDKVERVARYHKDPHSIAERSPLFARRGLFRA
ncbi:class 1 fructose-bisphosphatase [Pelagibius litoralis]|uniref:Fructose-1,6-bisphosphatase class 1 n=1 Tax=Pelagibius litoralis TaxID=374515 RepID=A0A967EVI0_9PROT|nr:class 1 fructose-bisphosphatase [Pelagibius litoralis]NIA68537.1 class 1 fructose-bisphosphatase [Pelagibius litoralis]